MGLTELLQQLFNMGVKDYKVKLTDGKVKLTVYFKWRWKNTPSYPLWQKGYQVFKGSPEEIYSEINDTLINKNKDRNYELTIQFSENEISVDHDDILVDYGNDNILEAEKIDTKTIKAKVVHLGYRPHVPDTSSGKEFVSERGNLLVTQNIYDHNNIGLAHLTVEDYCKWYSAYTILSDGKIQPVNFEDFEGYSMHGPDYVDHAINPSAFYNYAKDNWLRFDNDTFALVCKRWVEDVLSDDWTKLAPYLINSIDELVERKYSANIKGHRVDE